MLATITGQAEGNITVVTDTMRMGRVEEDKWNHRSTTEIS